MPEEIDQNQPEGQDQAHPRAAFEFALGEGETEPQCNPDHSVEDERPDHAPQTGDRFQYIGDYILEEEIARGAMGVVFRSIQRSLKREVALKMIHLSLANDSGLRQRFRIEAEAVAALDHPNIVSIYEVGEHQGYLYFSMRFLGGGNLAQGLPSIDGEGPKSLEKRIAKTVSKIARGIHHAHQRGILHRDLKPSNVLLDESGEPVITDFGLAKFANYDSDLTRSEAALGTPAYMSPEQATGRTREVSVASDVYSIGAILYELLTGQAPFQGGSHLEIMRRAAEDAPRPPCQIRHDLSPDLEVICLKSLSKPPRLRYASAEQLAEDLDRWQQGEPIRARRVGSWERFWLWAQRHPALASAWATATLLLAILAIGLPLSLFQINQARIAETRARQRTENILSRTRMTEADRLLEQEENTMASAFLAAVVDAEPDNKAAAEKLIYHLIYRNWILPEKDLSLHSQRVITAKLDEAGETLLCLREDGSLQMHDLASDSIVEIDHGVAHANDLLWHSSGSRFAVLGKQMFSVFSTRDRNRLIGPRAVNTPIIRAFFAPLGEAIFVIGGENRQLSGYLIDAPHRAPWIPSEIDGIRALEFRPGSPELAVIDKAGLTGWNYRQQKRVFDPIPNIEMASYWYTGEWLFADTDWRSPSGRSIRDQLIGGAILLSDTGEKLQEVSALHQPGQGRIPNELGNEISALWYGFARNKNELRPIGQNPFDQPSPGGQHIIRREPGSSHAARSSLEIVPKLRARVGERDLLPGWDGYELQHSRDGRRLIMTHPNQTRRQIWDAVLRRPLFEWEPRASESVKADASATRFVRFARGEPTTLWQAREGAALPAIWPTRDSVEKAIYAGDGDRIATIDHEGKIRIYDANNLTPISTDKSPSILKRFSKNGAIELFRSLKQLDVVAVGTTAGSLQLWNVNQSQPLSKVMMHPEPVDDLHWLPEVSRLVALYAKGNKHVAWVWDLESHTQILEPDGWEVPPCLAVGNQGRWLMLQTGERNIRIWDVRQDQWQGPEIQLPQPFSDRRSNPSFGAGFSPDGIHFFTHANGILQLHRLDSGEAMSRIESKLLQAEGERTIDFLDQGKRLLIAARNGFAVYDARTGAGTTPMVRLADLEMAQIVGENLVITATQQKIGTTNLEVWNPKTSRYKGTSFRLRGHLVSWQRSKDGDRFLFVSDNEWLLWNSIQSIVLFRQRFSVAGGKNQPRNLLESPSAILSPDGESVMVLHDSQARALSIWSFPRVRSKLPPDAVALAESVGGFRLEDDGSLQTVPPSQYLAVTRRIREAGSLSLEDKWMRWFVSPTPLRNVSPYSEVNPSEYANRLLTSATLSGVLEVIRRHPKHHRAWKQLQATIASSDRSPIENGPEILEKAGDLLSALESLIEGVETSHETRLQIAELLVGAHPFGELEFILSRTTQLGWRRMVLKWIEGSLGSQATTVNLTGEQLIRTANLVRQLGYSSDSQQRWLTPGMTTLKSDIERLEGLLQKAESSFENKPD